jgi:hypothetical protein
VYYTLDLVNAAADSNMKMGTSWLPERLVRIVSRNKIQIQVLVSLHAVLSVGSVTFICNE